VRKDLAAILKEEIETTRSASLEDHGEKFLTVANAVAVDSEAEVRISWSAPPYTVEVVYEKPSGPIDIDEESLGLDLLHELDEEQMRGLEMAEKDLVHEGKHVGGKGKRSAAVDTGPDGDEDEDDDDHDEVFCFLSCSLMLCDESLFVLLFLI
jgi:hypothetical protein